MSSDYSPDGLLCAARARLHDLASVYFGGEGDEEMKGLLEPSSDSLRDDGFNGGLGWILQLELFLREAGKEQ
jgi:hypothetical protein